MSNKGLNTSTKLGRLVFQTKDISVRMKPDVRAVVLRIFNVLDGDQESKDLRFRLRDDLERLGREPQLASLAKLIYKELPQS